MNQKLIHKSDGGMIHCDEPMQLFDSDMSLFYECEVCDWKEALRGRSN